MTGISTPEYRKIAEEVKTATPDSRSRQTRQNIFLSAPPPTRRSNSDPHRDASAPRVVFCGKYDTYMHEQMGVEFPPDTALVPALMLRFTKTS